MISPYVRRLRLATELRLLRTRAGLTHEQLAKKIGQSRAQISRLENAHAAPDLDDIIKILDVVGVADDEWTKIVTIAREAAERGWWESNSHAMGTRTALYANLEAGAVTIREYQQTFLPGLLQTPEFSRARNTAEAGLRPLDADPEKVLAGRTGRQRMLRRPGGPTYEVILDEVAIRRLSAPPEVVKAQLFHLAATVNGMSKIGMRVLPVSAVVGGYSVPRTAFSIYTYADPDDPVVVAVDTVTSDLILIDPAEVAPYDILYKRLLDAALSEDASVALLTSVAADLADH
ncbi:helix-turn-helix transcriptional regulator [Streptosporangiaceae bacterium NEAU-GS5]|nr:helix-turn-helix transcriptional regulator [Streptosporangiaceae bacterium NEAU-GS5]